MFESHFGLDGDLGGDADDDCRGPDDDGGGDDDNDDGEPFALEFNSEAAAAEAAATAAEAAEVAEVAEAVAVGMLVLVSGSTRR